VDPSVSFIVPCYNSAHFLRKCVDSILAQTYRDFEILIMDNCSSDNTPDVASSFRDPRVRSIRNETNIGHVRNFNKGIALSRGKYVWVVCVDDYLRSPNALQLSMDLMERNPEVGLVFSRSVEVRGDTEVGIAWWADHGTQDRVWEGPTFLRRLIESDCVIMSSAMMRKDCCVAAGSFSLDLQYSCDWHLWCQIALRNRVAYIAEPTVCCRIHEESLTASLNRLDTPICTLDELSVPWRIARDAEALGMASLRAPSNASIAGRAARAVRLRQGSDRGAQVGLSKEEFEILVRSNVRDANDEADLWSRFYRVLGDEQYWDGELRHAAQSYKNVLKLRPWSPKIWTKFIFLSMGGLGTQMRRFYAVCASAARLKKHPRQSVRGSRDFSAPVPDRDRRG
jgi:glycosyltransferase involved in cell wall biosynthesis